MRYTKEKEKKILRAFFRCLKETNCYTKVKLNLINHVDKNSLQYTPIDYIISRMRVNGAPNILVELVGHYNREVPYVLPKAIDYVWCCICEIVYCNIRNSNTISEFTLGSTPSCKIALEYINEYRKQKYSRK